MSYYFWITCYATRLVTIGIFCPWDISAGRMTGGILRLLDPFLGSLYKSHFPKFFHLNPPSLSIKKILKNTYQMWYHLINVVGIKKENFTLLDTWHFIIYNKWTHVLNLTICAFKGNCTTWTVFFVFLWLRNDLIQHKSVLSQWRLP